MARWFNAAGPCRPEVHYMLPAAARLPEVLRLVEQQSYFVLHAPRQAGKTTALLVSAEVGAPFSDDPGAAELAILADWREAAGRSSASWRWAAGAWICGCGAGQTRWRSR